MSDKDRIARRFDAAAPTYAAVTGVQRQAAEALGRAIVQSRVRAGGRVAEFGCGVGYLPEALLAALSPSLWVATDIAPAMTAAALARLASPAVVGAVMDAARPALSGGFDLVCSSLTLQWLDDPAGVLAAWRRLVRPGGRMAVATLTDGSFAEWRGALAKAGVPAPGPTFPTLDGLRAGFGPHAEVQSLTLLDRHPTALHFARAAKAAGIDASFARPLNPAAMRRALKAFDAAGAAVTYRIALVVERV